MRDLPRVGNLCLLVYFGSVCQPFTAEIELNVDIQPEQLSCEVEQIGHYIAILFACFTRQGPDYCAKFIMWDLTAQEQVAVSWSQTANERLLIRF